jgi:hypothetical protein
MFTGFTWEATVAFLGFVMLVVFILGIGAATWVETRKTKALAAQQDNLRQLIGRYEQLAEKTLDAQQRAAAIEQILRTVE